jgi:hypothetical protein
MTHKQLRPNRVCLWINPELYARYQRKRAEFERLGKDTQPVWVFHGTKHEATLQICQGGFKIGGSDTAVVNGTVHGKGVYTATGPGTPMGYNERLDPTKKHVILAMALRGEDGVDSRCPVRDWLLFTSADQLLPLYVVYYE